MKGSYGVLVLFMMFFFSATSLYASTGWITEIYNDSNSKMKVHTNTSGPDKHHGEVKKGSLACAGKTEHKHSHMTYEACPGNHLKFDNFGIPWYKSSNYLTIWNASKYGEDIPTGKDHAIQVFISSCFEEKNKSKDCVHFRDNRGNKLNNPTEMVLGKPGSGNSHSFLLRFDDKGLPKWEIQNNSSFVDSALKWVDNNKEFLLKVFEAAK